MKRITTRHFGLAILFLFILFSFPAYGFDLVSMQPNYHRYQIFTTEPLVLVFDASLDSGTVSDNSIIITNLHTSEIVDGVVALSQTNMADDTLTFTPSDGVFPFGRRLQVQIDPGLKDLGGLSFTGTLPYLGVFVANIPNDLERPDPGGGGFTIDVFVNSNVLLGFNPLDPESTDPEKYNYIPGMSLTEAWKVSLGHPDIIIAVVDDGIGSLADEELSDHLFLNKGELPQPRNGDTPCPNWDCNGDGRFNARDYDNDPAAYDTNGNGYLDPEDLIELFSDGIDNDGNGLVDDICGWDFFRNVNTPLGVSEFREGTHGGGRAKDAGAIANNGHGDKPGTCPECTILPIRVGEAIMTELNIMASGVKYAMDMGAKVMVVANGVSDFSEETEQIFVDAYEAGSLVVAASGDELGFHHIWPAAGEDSYSVKAILPIPPVELFGPVNLSVLAFVESYCTNYGAHTESTAVTGACSSEGTANTGGIAGLLFSYAKELGIDLTPGEVRQLINMTADDIKANCFAFNLQGCKPGWEQNFGYGRMNAYKAIQRLGDPFFGVPERIPPDIRVTKPRWWTTIDPIKTPTFDVEGYIYARGRPYQYTVELAKGVEPNDDQFVVVATGSGAEPKEGILATVDALEYVDAEWLRRQPEDSNDFTITLRVRAWWTAKDSSLIVGEIRKSIAWHTDDDPNTGLLPGFPIYTGISGESSPVLYDLDGDLDGALEIIFGTSIGTVEVYKRNPETGQYSPAPGFPVELPQTRAYPDSLIASPAVGPLFGDGIPYIVVASYYGLVYAIHPDGNNHAGGPFVAGFPVSANPPDNGTPLSYGHGNAFLASPVLADLDGDGLLEIIAASFDQHAYAWKPIDQDHDNKADPFPGWPVPLFSDAAHGLVPPDKVCDTNAPAQVLGTPAAGILDPDHPNPDISGHPSVIIATTETCDDFPFPTSRVYAIYWNGLENANGPFLPDWPAKTMAPAGDSLPIPPLTIGTTSSPAVARWNGEAIIGTGTFFWFPQLITWSNDQTKVRQLLDSRVNLGCSANGSFAHFDDTDNLWYFYPTAGFLNKVDNVFDLEMFNVCAWRLDQLNELKFRRRLEDINFFMNPVIADLNRDGWPEMIAGSGGYIIHAANVNSEEPAGWPKFTQGWSIATPAVADLDGDGRVEVVAISHEGYLFAWATEGSACHKNALNGEWPRFHHDPYNSGFYGLDAIPPNMVTDLAAYKTDISDSFELHFTAPGNDFGCGKAAMYDLRYTTNAGANLRDPAVWDAAEVATAPLIEYGGTEIIALVKAPGAASFAMRAIDDQNLMSFISNIAVPQENPPDDDTTDDDIGDDDTADDDTADDDFVDDDAADDDTSDDDTGKPAPAEENNHHGGCGC